MATPEPRIKIDIGSMSPGTYGEDQVFTDEEIRDVLDHDSDTSDFSQHNVATVYVDNALDQAVAIQVMANRIDGVAGAVEVGAPFNVAAGDQEARTLEPTDEGWLPYYYVTATALVAPAAGELNVYILKRTVV
ncbi:MAG: hypothetical protein PHU95_03510 [Candidatus Thermoplasmatota archaeon]|nr:hypothetical protein [Candidatus Thermoplasmatota archaeon]